MNEILRLIRLTLLLRIAVTIVGAVAIAGAVGELTLLGNSTPIVIDLMVMLPSVLILAVATAAPMRGWTSVRFVKGLLIAVIVAQALEAIASRIWIQLFITNSGVDVSELLRQSQSGVPRQSYTLSMLSSS